MNQDELIDGYLDGALDEAGLAEFDRALASDPAFARAFAAACAEDTILHELVTGVGAKTQPVPSPAEAARRRARTARLRSQSGRSAWIPFAAAAAVLLAVAFWLASGPARRSTDDRHVAVRPPVSPSVGASALSNAQTLRRSDAQTSRRSDAQTSPDEPEASPPVDAAPEPKPAPPSSPVTPTLPKPPAPAVATAPPPVAPPSEVPVAPPAPATGVSVAVLREIRGKVEIVTPSGRATAAPGRGLKAGEGIETDERGGTAVAELPDGTRLRLAAGARLRGIIVNAAGPGGAERRVGLDRGAITADVVHQAAGQSIVFVTPHAEARVLGTRLTLTVTDPSTRLDVEQGRVRLTRTRDGASLEVPAGTYVVAEPDGDLRLRAEYEQSLSFQDGVAPTPRYEGSRDAELEGMTQKQQANVGRATQIHVDGISPDQDGERYGLFRWDLSAIPAGSRVLRAEVGFFVMNDPHGTSFAFHALLQPWEENDATWMLRAGKAPWQKPGAAGEQDRGAEILGSPAPKGKGEYGVPLNDAGVRTLQGWIDRPPTNHGMILADPKNTDALGVATRESRIPAQRPRLTVVFLPPGRPR